MAEAVVNVFAVVLVLAAAAPAGGQTLPPVPLLQQPTVFRSSSALVALTVTVQDKTAKYVAGLQPDDFVIYEDGVKQEVRFFEAAAVPLDLIVLIDTSASMGDKVEIVHDAASGFLRTLRDGDRGAVVGFAESVAMLQPLTSDRALLEKAVRSTGARGSTSLNNAVYIALKQFGRRPPDSEVRRQAIVVLSDGTDTSSLVSLDDVLGVARQTGVSVYTVGLQARRLPGEAAPSHRIDSDSDLTMKTLARETGAQAFFPAPAQLKSVYASIATELANQYSIGYIPAKARADGGFRRVVVQVITKPELRPRTRQGYTAGTTATATLQGMGAGPR
jgi:Ca-activated chloride channel family protein